MEQIAQRLKEQMIGLCPRSLRHPRSFMYKQALDPTTEKVRAMCQRLRKFAGGDKRVILHYNGHGVPHPTDNGELWVFNRELTQYLPLPIYEVQRGVAGPALYILDCPRGELVLSSLVDATGQHKEEYQKSLLAHHPDDGPLPEPIPWGDYMAMAPCGRDESLPSHPDLPADLLTACLTTPVQMSLRWCYSRSLLRSGFQREGYSDAQYRAWILAIPGSIEDRQSPLGELHWIFTAITETIAWDVMPSSHFQKLYRADLIVATLWRNFLLADRLLRDAQCTPGSHPPLPVTHHHPMWQTWDQILDYYLEQLPRIVRQPTAFRSSLFFEQHLMAFQVWLELARDRPTAPRDLPIVLQALLSPLYRLQALELFQQFVDLGVWAVNLALEVGLFHYILRLLQRATGRTASLLIFIWAKLVAADHSLQEELIKAEAHSFFIQALRGDDEVLRVEDQVHACFILSVMMDDYPVAQSACYKAELVPVCVGLFEHAHAPLRRWALLCLGKLVEGNGSIKRVLASTMNLPPLFLRPIHDAIAKVRAAALFAMGCFMGAGPAVDSCETDLAMSFKSMAHDIHPAVRREFVTALSQVVSVHVDSFCQVALATAKLEIFQLSEEERDQLREILSSTYGRLWRLLCSIQGDPLPSLASAANVIVVRVHSTASAELLQEKSGTGQAEKLHHYLMNLSSFSSSMQKGGLSSSQGATPSVIERTQSSSIRKHLTQSWRRSGSTSSRLATPAPLAPLSRSSSSTPTTQDPGTLSPSPIHLGSLRRSSATTLRRLTPPETQPWTANHRHSLSPPTQRFHVPGSSLFPWACESFNTPRLREDEEEVSPIKRWKQKKTEQLMDRMDEVRGEVSSHKIETQLAALVDDVHIVTGLVVHPFYSVVVASSTDDIIRVWDWKEKTLVSKFSNTNALGTQVNTMSVINPMEASDLLMTSASDGVIRLWKTYYQAHTSLVTAWRAHKQPNNSSPLVHMWKQHQGVVVTAGEYPLMRMWDVEHGRVMQDIPTETADPITCLAQELPTGPIMVAGDAEGGVRIFDCRVSSRASLVKTFSEHKRAVIQVEMMFDSVKIVSGSVGGDVRLFDLRSPGMSTDSIQAHSRSEMTSLAVHRHADVLATGTRNQTIKVMNHTGQRLNDIKYYSKYLGQRIGSVSCLSFHPYQPILAAGDTDGTVAVYQSAAWPRPS